MDSVSFSDDTDDSFPSQNLRNTIDDMSRRLDFDSGSETTQPRYFANLYQDVRGVPDGCTTSINPVPIKFKSDSLFPIICQPSLTSSSIEQLKNSYELSATSSTLGEQDESIPDIASDEPVDLSNSPLDLRKKTKTKNSNTLSTSKDQITSNSLCQTEKTVDSFDSMMLFPKRESNHISVNATSSSIHSIHHDEFSNENELAGESKDVTYAILSTDIVGTRSGQYVSDSTETLDTEWSTYHNMSEDVSTMENDILCKEVDKMNSIVSKEITSTVQSILPMYDTSPSLYSSHSLNGYEQLNQTYNLSGLSDVSHHPDGATVTLDDTALLPMEVEPDSALVNVGAPASSFAMENQNDSSFSSVGGSCLDNTFSTTWSVKKAMKSKSVSPGSSLKLTFTRTPTKNIARRVALPSQFKDLDTFPVFLNVGLTAEHSFDSFHKRSIAGSNSYSEESTIYNEFSHVIPFGTKANKSSSYPETPDITLHTPPRNRQQPPRPTFPVANVGETSTPNDNLLSSHNLSRSAAEFLKYESPRRKLLKKRVIECQGSDSILNIGFCAPSDESTPSKMESKRKSLLKNLKRQLLCAKETSFAYPAQRSDSSLSSSSSQAEKTRRWVGRRILAKLKPRTNLRRCIINSKDDTCPTTLFATLTDSSTGLASWCRHIRDVTRIPIVPEQVVPVLEDNTTMTPARTELHTSTKSEADATPKTRKDSKTTALFDHLQPLPNFQTAEKTTYEGVHKLTKSTKVTAESNEDTEAGTDIETPKKFNHLQSMPTLHLGPSEISDGLSDGVFKKPAVPAKKRISSSKSDPAIRSTRDEEQNKCHIKPSSGNRTAVTKPQSSSTPLRRLQQPLPETRQQESNDQSMMQEITNLDTSDVRIKLISEVGRQTAEWLASFVGDVSSKVHQMRCDEQPNRNVLLQLCSRCKIKVQLQWPGSDSSMFRLKKTRETRAPTESDLQHLVRAIRRKNESSLPL